MVAAAATAAVWWSGEALCALPNRNQISRSPAGPKAEAFAANGNLISVDLRQGYRQPNLFLGMANGSPAPQIMHQFFGNRKSACTRLCLSLAIRVELGIGCANVPVATSYYQQDRFG